MSLLQQTRIVLVEPAGSANVGSVARVMKNMGLAQLVMVNPRCDWRGPEALKMAVHASELLSSARPTGSLAEAIADCHWVIGTTGREQAYPPEWQIQSPRHALPQLIKGMIGAIVFGPEDRGLSNDELALCQHHLMIPTDPVYPSLNLAQAVGITAYELRLAALTPMPAHPISAPAGLISNPQNLAVADTLAGFFKQLEVLLLEIGYLRPQTARRKLSKFRALFYRANLTLADIALLRGVVRQLGWYHRQSRSDLSPKDRPELPKQDLHPS